MSKTGVQGSMESIITVGHSGSWICPECGKNIAKRYAAIIRHQKYCNGKMKGSQKSKVCPVRGKLYVFYHNCMIHALGTTGLARYTGLDIQLITKYLKITTLEKILAKDYPAKKKGGNPTGISTPKGRPLREKEKTIQQLLLRKKKC